jgi:hypothetical protein
MVGFERMAKSQDEASATSESTDTAVMAISALRSLAESSQLTAMLPPA